MQPQTDLDLMRTNKNPAEINEQRVRLRGTEPANGTALLHNLQPPEKSQSIDI